MAPLISEVTGIDEKFLDRPTSHFRVEGHQLFSQPSPQPLKHLLHWASVAQRMSWASRRKTTRIEDTAYCLLGIFDINMPLLCGEVSRAFRRLQEEIMKYSDDQSLLPWGRRERAVTTPAESVQELRCRTGFDDVFLIRCYLAAPRPLPVHLSTLPATHPVLTPARLESSTVSIPVIAGVASIFRSYRAILMLVMCLYIPANAYQHTTSKQNNTLLAPDTCMLNTDRLNVAIVGSGIAGASTAYFLSHLSAQGYFATQRQRPLTITIYDEKSDVGGSLVTVYPPDIEKPLDTGADGFSPEDWCMSTLVNAASVHTKPVTFRPLTWNGTDAWTNELCYSNTPLNTVVGQAAGVLKEIRESVLFWYTGRRSPAHVFRHAHALLWKRWQPFLAQSPSDVNVLSGHANLDDFMKLRASDLLGDLGLSRDYQSNTVEPCVRAMFGLNLDQIPALASFLATTNPEFPPISIPEGNQSLIIKLFNKLIRQAQLTVRLNTQVRGFEPGTQSRWRLDVRESPLRVDEDKVEFDAVIFTGSSFEAITDRVRGSHHGHSPSSAESPPGSPHYFDVHVTHFSTYARLAFELPWDIITASSATNMSDRGILRICTKPYFYIDRQGCSDDDECDQFVHVYRIDSRERLEDDDILRLIGQDGSQGLLRGHKMVDISWVDRRMFRRPLPAMSRPELEVSSPKPIEQRPGIFDVQNRVVDTLEMNCRMGRAVAHEIYDGIAGSS